MKPWQARVILERAELDVKIAKLDEFLIAPAFKEIVFHDRELLIRQKYAMSDYSDLLRQRIDRFQP